MISKKFIVRTKCDKNMQEAVMEILIQYEAVQMVVMVQNYFTLVNFDNILWQNGISKSKLLKISTEQRMLCILNVIFMLWVNFVSLKIFCMKMLFGKNNKTKLEAFFNQEKQEGLIWLTDIQYGNIHESVSGRHNKGKYGNYLIDITTGSSHYFKHSISTEKGEYCSKHKGKVTLT